MFRKLAVLSLCCVQKTKKPKCMFFRVTVRVYFARNVQPRVARATNINQFPYLAKLVQECWRPQMVEQIPSLNKFLQLSSMTFATEPLNIQAFLAENVHNRSTSESAGDASPLKTKRRRVQGPESLPIPSLSSSSSFSSSIPGTSLLSLSSSSSSSSAYPPSSSKSSHKNSPRLTFKLTEEQASNVDWMIKREEEPFDRAFWNILQAEGGLSFYYNAFSGQYATLMPSSPNSGGFLTDGVGMGKTVQTLHVIVRSKGSLPTLVILPTSLLSQWKSELAKHTSGLKVVSYYDAKDKQNVKVGDLQQADVVLTTYSSLVKGQRTRAYAKFLKARRERKKKDPFSDRSAPLMEEDAFEGPKSVKVLQQVTWSRLILDEGHELRNPNTSKFNRILELDAKSRWILSATPFRTWDDFFSLLKLLHFPLYNLMSVSLRAFKDCMYNPNRNQLVKPVLQQAFRSLMCGHSVASSSTERPPVVFQKHLVDFETKEQQEFYALVREETSNVFQEMMSSGTFASKPMQALAALRTLRRAAASCGGRFSPSKVKQQSYSHGKWFRLPQQVQGHQKYREATKESIGNTEDCSICLDNFDNPIQTSCGHIYCEECILSHINSSLIPTCPQCRRPISNDQDEEKYAKHLFLAKAVGVAAAVANSDGKRGCGKAEAIESVADGGDTVVMTAKMNALVNLLFNLQQEELGAKAIVFSQFSESIRELSKLFSSLGIKHAKILGSFSSKKRSQGPLF